MRVCNCFELFWQFVEDPFDEGNERMSINDLFVDNSFIKWFLAEGNCAVKAANIAEFLKFDFPPTA